MNKIKLLKHTLISNLFISPKVLIIYNIKTYTRIISIGDFFKRFLLSMDY